MPGRVLLAWVKNRHYATFNHRAKYVAGRSPLHRSREVLEAEAVRALAGCDIPDLDAVIDSRCCNQIFYCVVPPNAESFLAVAGQAHVFFFDVASQAAFGNDPQFDLAIFRGRSKQVVVEGAETQVSDATLVTLNQWNVCIKALKVISFPHSN